MLHIQPRFTLPASFARVPSLLFLVVVYGVRNYKSLRSRVRSQHIILNLTCNSVQAKCHQLLIWRNFHWPSHEGHFTSSAERNFFVLGFIASGVSPSEYRFKCWGTSKILPFTLRHTHNCHLRSESLPFSCTNIGSLGTQPHQLRFRHCTFRIRFHCTARFLCVVIFH